MSKVIRNDWTVNGNEGIDSIDQFIGTADNIDFPIRTNNILRGLFKSDGPLELTALSDYIPLKIKGNSTQTNDLLKIIDSSNNPLFVVDKDGEIGIKKAIPTELIDAVEDIANQPGVFRITHTSSSGLTSDACLEVVTQSGGGDPAIVFRVASATNWALGIDNSDGDAFKIAEDLNLSFNARIKILKGGKVFINRNLEVGSIQSQDDVQVQILAGDAQTANIFNIGEDGGIADLYMSMDKDGDVFIVNDLEVQKRDVHRYAVLMG